jgi:hypothetical protein
MGEVCVPESRESGAERVQKEAFHRWTTTYLERRNADVLHT